MTRKPTTKAKTLHGGLRWSPLTNAEASDANSVINRLREALCILVVHKTEWEAFSLLGLCPHSPDPDVEQASILVNRIGYEAVLLYGATEPAGQQHERADGLEGPPHLPPPPSKTVAEVRERLAVAITVLADIATNPAAIKTLRLAPMGGGRMEAAIALQLLEGCAGVPSGVLR